MVKSMTGYGKAEITAGNKKITVEVRSLNSKQLDLAVRMPAIYRPFEYDIRSMVGKTVQRGKADVYISTESAGAVMPVNINRELFRAYYETLKGIVSDMPGGEFMDATLVSSVLRMPEVVSGDSAVASEEERQALMSAVVSALEGFDAFRVQEGKTLIDDLIRRIELIEKYRREVEPFEKRRVETIKARIRENIASVGIPVDENRLEQEMIFYVEKLDVTEEKVRLDNHCRYFKEVAASEENVGRKLGFIAQEMGREINTLGSKANDSDMQQIVVRMKDELEKIKEQVLNIL